MSRLRELFRAARELYLDCVRERTLAETWLEDEEVDPAVGHTLAPRAMAARAREETMRQASRVLVHHINGPDAGQP